MNRKSINEPKFGFCLAGTLQQLENEPGVYAFPLIIPTAFYRGATLLGLYLGTISRCLYSPARRACYRRAPHSPSTPTLYNTRTIVRGRMNRRISGLLRKDVEAAGDTASLDKKHSGGSVPLPCVLEREDKLNRYSNHGNQAPHVHVMSSHVYTS